MALLHRRRYNRTGWKLGAGAAFLFLVYQFLLFDRSEDVREEPQRPDINNYDFVKDIEKRGSGFQKLEHQSRQSWKVEWEDPPAQVARKEILKDIYKYTRPEDSTYKLNETLSQTISLNRLVPDIRPPSCADIHYDVATLPTVSVIFPFYNEALSFLLRAIHSVLNHTPGILLTEIILVDDCSKNDNLKEALDRYIGALPSGKVIIVRNTHREGLIRARMKGVSLATGDVVVFHDAHTEVAQGWIEPILQVIKDNPNVIVQPTVDPIEPDTLEWPYKENIVYEELWHGVFMWDMRFAWQKIDPKYSNWQRSPSDPYPNAVLVGCALAANRMYFEEIGGFDEGLNVWGGENIELSLRTWMCGGRMVIHPCSRVGHVFKPFSYSFDGSKEEIIMKNSIRVVESWMPAYSHYFYSSNYVYDFKRVSLSAEESRSIQVRRLQAKSKKCKSMDWYLAHIMPEQATPTKDIQFFGEIQNKHSKMCFKETSTRGDGYVSLTADCYTYSRSRPEAEYGFKSNGQLTYNDRCVTVTDSLLLKVVSCLEVAGSEWRFSFELLPDSGFTYGRILLRGPNMKPKCLQQVTNIAENAHLKQQMPQFMPCFEDMSDQWQHWSITFNFDYSTLPMEKDRP